MAQVHDNIIAAYHVDFENERLVLKTQFYYDGKLRENTDVVFTGYFTHLFGNEHKGSVIFDIEEREPIHFYEREHELIEENRRYCWPINYQTPETKAELLGFLQKNEYKVFEISSSYGLCGWVLAKQMEIIATEVEANDTREL